MDYDDDEEFMKALEASKKALQEGSAYLEG